MASQVPLCLCQIPLVGLAAEYVVCYSARLTPHPQKARLCREGTGADAGEWTMIPLAANQQKQRIADMAWSRCSPTQLAITCEDGSLHLLDVSLRDPARHCSTYPSLQASC